MKRLAIVVAVELPEKQGLKPGIFVGSEKKTGVAVELPEKQGLKPILNFRIQF